MVTPGAAPSRPVKGGWATRAHRSPGSAPAGAVRPTDCCRRAPQGRRAQHLPLGCPPTALAGRLLVPAPCTLSKDSHVNWEPGLPPDARCPGGERECTAAAGGFGPAHGAVAAAFCPVALPF